MSAETDLRTAASKTQEWTVRRDKLIREARRAGLSFRQIGEIVALSHTAVAKIVAR